MPLYRSVLSSCPATSSLCWATASAQTSPTEMAFHSWRSDCDCEGLLQGSSMCSGRCLQKRQVGGLLAFANAPNQKTLSGKQCRRSSSGREPRKAAARTGLASTARDRAEGPRDLAGFDPWAFHQGRIWSSCRFIRSNTLLSLPLALPVSFNVPCGSPMRVHSGASQ